MTSIPFKGLCGWSVFCLTLFLFMPIISAEDSDRAQEVTLTAVATEDISTTEPQVMINEFSDHFRDVPGVLLQKTGPAQASPYIRGFTGYHVMMLQDGFRLNNSVFRSGPNQYWNTINPSSVGRLMINKSAASARYGSGAVASVEAISRDEQKQAIKTRVASAEQSLMNTLIYDQIIGETKLYMDGTVNEMGDMRAADLGELEGTSYSEYGGSIRLVHPIRDGDLTLSHQTFRQNNAPRWHSTTQNHQGWHGLSPGTEIKRDLDQERQFSYIRYDHDRFFLGYSRQIQKEVQDRDRSTTDHRLSGFDVTTDAFIGEFSLGQSTKIGTEVYRDEVGSFYLRNGVQRNDTPIGDDSTYLDAGLYVEHQIRVKSFELNLAGRWSHADADVGRYLNANSGAVESLSKSWGKASFGLSLKQYLEQGSWTFGVNQGFRAPNLSDLSKYGTVRSGAQSLPAPELEEENFTTYEWSSEIYLGTTTLGIDLYHTQLRGLIQDVNTVVAGNTFTQKVNGDKAYVEGVELSAQYSIGVFEAHSSMSYQVGKNKSKQEYLSRVNPLTFDQRLTYHSSNDWKAECHGKYVAEADHLSTSDQGDTQRIPPGGTPSYFVLDLVWSKTFREKNQLHLGIENVLDEDYRVHGSGQNSVGRNFIGAVELAL